MGIPRTTLQERLKNPKTEAPGRVFANITDGHIIVFSDAHFLPGKPPSTAYRALLKFIKRFKPEIIVANGDVTDLPTISRHPPLNWDELPTVYDEIVECKERLDEIARAGNKARTIFPIGNHDERFEKRLAQVAPELRGVYGTSLKDHFGPSWEPCYSLWVNDDLVIKHRYKGGQNAPFNNALCSGRSFITGHLHNQSIHRITDLNGTRFGVDTGCLADPYGEQFTYMEDNPRSHVSGFCLVTYRDGKLLMPELIRVVEEGVIDFRGAFQEV